MTWGGAVTEASRRWKLALLTLVVLAVHLWLLGGLPRVIIGSQSTGAFVARTVTPPQPAAPVVKPAEPPQVTRQPAHGSPQATAPERHKEQTESAGGASRAPARPSAPASTSATATAAASAASPASATERAAKTATSTQAAGATHAFRVAVAPSARYRYDVIASAKGMTLRGNAVLEWRNDGHEYDALLSMSSPLPFVKPRTQHSTGLVTATGLAPVRFSDKSRSEEATHFDREAGRIVFSTNKPEAALDAGAQDRLSIVMQLGALLAGDPSKYPPGTEIKVQTASTKEAEPWTFTVDETETLALPGGRVAAVRLTRNPRREYDVKVELWLAPGAAYAPVRLRLTQPNGDWVDQQWSSTDRG
jgi:hypothetical protein